MRWINYITTGLSLLMATGALFFLPPPASWIVAAIFAAIAAYAATAKGGKIAKSKFIVRLKGFAWTREDFCRGWLITGDTGSSWCSHHVHARFMCSMPLRLNSSKSSGDIF